MYVLTIIAVALGTVISPLANSRTEVTTGLSVVEQKYSFKTSCDEAQAELAKQNIPGLLRVTGWCAYVR